MKRNLNFNLILASASPRRKELLENAGFHFKVHVVPIEEKIKDKETIPNYIHRNCTEKALAVSQFYSEKEIILSADTVVVTKENQLLEKPNDKADAVRMLKILSGTTHFVYTAYAIFSKNKKLAGKFIKTDVIFRELMDEEIEAYVQSAEPMDKSGAYGIQGFAQGFVESVDGNYTSVMGLPLSHVIVDLYEIHKNFKVIF